MTELPLETKSVARGDDWRKSEVCSCKPYQVHTTCRSSILNPEEVILAFDLGKRTKNSEKEDKEKKSRKRNRVRKMRDVFWKRT
jgi:hypothetical protein